jgi:hypothetical protein
MASASARDAPSNMSISTDRPRTPSRPSAARRSAFRVVAMMRSKRVPNSAT